MGIFCPASIQSRQSRGGRLQRRCGRNRRLVAAPVMLHRQPRGVHQIAQASVCNALIRERTASLQFYKIVFTGSLHTNNEIFPFWSNPVLLNWRHVTQ